MDELKDIVNLGPLFEEPTAPLSPSSLAGFVPDAANFRKLMSLVSLFSEEPTFRIGSGHIAVRALDPSEVSMLDLVIYSRMEPEGETRRVAFNVERFLKLCPKLSRKGDKFEGMAFELAERAITLRVGNTSFGLPVYEPEHTEIPLPSISDNYLAADVPIADLLEAVRSFRGLTDRVELGVTDCDRVSVRGSCDTYSSQGETKEVTVITSSKASPSIESAKYDVDRLVRLLTAMKPMAEIITLRWGKDLPLELTVKAPASPVLSLKSWLASLIES